MSRPLRSTDPTEWAGYKLVSRLGEGGQGVVYLGRSVDGRLVAIKILHATLIDDKPARRRFARELEAARRVDSPCTARILDAKVDGDVAYIISEYIQGTSLQTSVKLWGPWPVERLEPLAIAMATALVAFRNAGVVHRDFKPSNVLLSPDGPRLIDFGIARLVDTAGSSNSQMLGTPPYMAPEQFSGERLSSAVDVFAFGCTVAYAANGFAPFGGNNVPAMIHRILHQEPDLGELTGMLREVVAACLNKDPNQRPAAHQILARLKGDETTWLAARSAGAAADEPEPEPEPTELDTARPNVARIYDYFLGGKDNFAADREAAEQILRIIPEARTGALVNRAFLGRAVRYLASAGIRQFIDIGAGLPTQANVHEVAHQVEPAARVVYVDNDPVIRVHAQALLHSADTATVIEADLRDPDKILENPELRAFIDFSEPVAVLLVGILHFIADFEDPYGLVARVRDRLAPGSHLAVSHATADTTSHTGARVTAVYSQATAPLIPRGHADVRRFFDGFTLVEPGLVYAPQWRPDSPFTEVADPAKSHVLVGVARKE
ncbi:MAG TPA: SAM-dependent methyltransferase [Streptosporangiaceae bacterium]|nr:SAM-dependent methyltransferase [Streptosporangiaceae bacterium]